MPQDVRNPLPTRRTVRSVGGTRTINALPTVPFVKIDGVIDATYAYDGSNDYPYELREGCLMAKITASGKWVPVKRTNVTADGGATATAIPVVNAAFFKVGDTITVGGDSGKTITAVNYSTNTITVSGSAFTFANDEAVIASGDLAGAQTAIAVLDEHVNLRDSEMDDEYDSTTGHLVIAGYVDDDMLLGDLDAVVAAASLPAQLILKSDTGLE